MQDKEFDKLISGEDAKWAEVPQTAVNLNKQEMSKLVIESEVDIPKEKQEEIQAFIKLLIGLKVKPGEIRRRVKTRFNITVV